MFLIYFHRPSGACCLATTCLLQFAVALALESRYEQRISKSVGWINLVSTRFLGHHTGHHGRRLSKGAAKAPRQAGGMGEPRSRSKTINTTMIITSGALPLWMRARDIILTILMWMLYLYFIRGLLVFCTQIFCWAFEAGFCRTCRLSCAFWIRCKNYISFIAANGGRACRLGAVQSITLPRAMSAARLRHRLH